MDDASRTSPSPSDHAFSDKDRRVPGAESQYFQLGADAEKDAGLQRPATPRPDPQPTEEFDTVLVDNLSLASEEQ